LKYFYMDYKKMTTAIIFMNFFLLILLIVIAIINTKGREGFYLASPILFIIIVFLVLNLLLFIQGKISRVEIKDEQLFYRTIFRKDKKIRLIDIDKAYLKIGKSGTKPYKRIEIEPKPESGLKPFFVALNYGEYEKCKELLNILERK